MYFLEDKCEDYPPTSSDDELITTMSIVLFSLIVLVVFFNFPPYPSPFMRITFKAEWNDVRWALYGPFGYEKIGFAISTVGTFEA